jgi:Ca-activated chloride channel homolog
MKTFITILIVAQFATMSIQAQQPHHGELTTNGSLYFRAEPVNNFLPQKAGNVYYYVHLQGVKKMISDKNENVPMDLSVVLDKSGSMAGDKLKYTKEALKYVVNQLGSRDIISIVLYDSDVSVFLEPQKLEGDRTELLRRIDGIADGSSTNLEGGIRKGYDLIKKVKKINETEMIHRVLLLSDGLANVGMSDPEGLAAITRKYFEQDHISISTFGVGNDYNENLMAKIALQGGGLYYFIYSAEKLPEIFKEELKGMSNVVAKNTVLKVKFPGELTYERTYSFNSNVKNNILEINCNDIFAEEQKSILICFKTKGKLNSPIVIETVIDYLNANNEPMTPVADLRKSEIKPAVDEKEYDSGYNKAASEGYALGISQELYDNAIEFANAEKFKEAKEKVAEAREVLDTHFKKVGEHVFLRELDKKLSEYALLIDDMKDMDRETFRYNIKFQKRSSFYRKARAKF